MKKIFLSLFMLAATAGVINAQKPGHDKMKHNQESAIKNLNLTEDQKAKFKSINEDFRKQMTELKKKDDITVKEWRSKEEQLKKDHHDKLQSVLTADQKTQLGKMKQERMGKMKEMNAKRFDKMKQELALTDEQSKKFKDMQSATAEKMKAIHENSSLTQEQKKEQSKEIRKQNKESMKSILTEEQLKKMQEKKIKGKGHKQAI